MGGLTETTVPWPGSAQKPPTGVFFPESTTDSLFAALQLFLKREKDFNPRAVREHSLAFGREIFKEKFRAAVEEARNSGDIGSSGPADRSQKRFEPNPKPF